ncbi:hypothetical protein BDV32DRAFT_130373 [Aspergillus pseudonomiae]|nr:hypothetical protein BDV32DRAFT_130373 [Aspergillus pseudonomiae]
MAATRGYDESTLSCCRCSAAHICLKDTFHHDASNMAFDYQKYGLQIQSPPSVGLHDCHQITRGRVSASVRETVRKLCVVLSATASALRIVPCATHTARLAGANGSG